MAKVSELKERARALEQDGDLAKAQAIYEHILRHLEGTPAMNAEVPLFVKVGDLCLRQGDAAGAVTHYERAAEIYLRVGSARSIAALAEKIRRADPTRDDEGVRLGRSLLEHGHAAAAATVVRRYAERVERTDVVEVLDEAGDAEGETGAAAVTQALDLLASRPADEPDEPEAGEEAEPEGAPEPPAAPRPKAPSGPIVHSSMADTLSVSADVIEGRTDADAPAEAEEEDAAGEPAQEELRPATGLPLVGFEEAVGSAAPSRPPAAPEAEAEEEEEPEAPAEPEPAPEPESRADRADAVEASPEPEEPEEPEEADDLLVLKTGAEPAGAPAGPTASAPTEEPEAAPEQPDGGEAEEPDEEPAAPAAAGRGGSAAARADSLVEQAIAASLQASAERSARVEAEPPVPERPAPKTDDVPLRPTRDDGARPLLREREPRGRPRMLGVAAAIVVIGGGFAGAWVLGWLPFGGGGTGTTDGPPPVANPPGAVTPAAVDTVADSLARDTAVTDTGAGPADTTSFGPIGFNALRDTALPAESVIPPPVSDSVVVAALDTATPAPPPPAVVVPPGYATVAEIVVIRGLPVLSVAETSGGVQVTQEGEGGVEIVLVAARQGGAAVAGVSQVTVEARGDTAVGTARVDGYRVDARAPIAADVLETLLQRLIRARPIN